MSRPPSSSPDPSAGRHDRRARLEDDHEPRPACCGTGRRCQPPSTAPGSPTDSEAMVECIERLGADVRWDAETGDLLVVGTAPRSTRPDGAGDPSAPAPRRASSPPSPPWVVAATAWTGSPRPRARPMGGLHDALVSLGAGITPEGVGSSPGGHRGLGGRRPADDGQRRSSQFVTALLLAGRGREAWRSS